MRNFRFYAQILASLALFTAFAGCGRSTTGSNGTEDTSASGVVAGVVGGSLSASGSNSSISFLEPKSNHASPSLLNSLIPSALAATSCPTFKTMTAGCVTSANSMWLSYNDCSFGSATSTWTGVQLLQISSGSAVCGTFPNPGASGTLLRQVVANNTSSIPSTLTRTSSFGTSVALDDASSNLGNFDGTTIANIGGTSGYGTLVTFNGSDARSGLTVARRIHGALFDMSVTTPTPLTISETFAGATTRTITGTVKVYHNLLRVLGTSTFNSVVHSDACCIPVSGSITTSFTMGVTGSPTTAGAKLVGKSETLTFSAACGNATYLAADGTSSNVVISNCF